jgi:hypothetical protein
LGINEAGNVVFAVVQTNPGFWLGNPSALNLLASDELGAVPVLADDGRTATRSCSSGPCEMLFGDSNGLVSLSPPLDQINNYLLGRDGALIISGNPPNSGSGLVSEEIWSFGSDWRRIIGNGDSPPGIEGDARFTGFPVSPILGADDRLAFLAFVQAPAFGHSGLWVADADNIKLVMVGGKLTSDGPEWSDAPQVFFPTRDSVYFYASRRLNGEASASEGVWRWNGSSIDPVLLVGERTSEGFAIREISLSDANADAGVAIKIWIDVGEPTLRSRILLGQPGHLRTIVERGDPAPGTDAVFEDFSGAALNRRGMVAFVASLTGPNIVGAGRPDTPPNDHGIWGGDVASGIGLVFRAGTTVTVAPSDTRVVLGVQTDGVADVALSPAERARDSFNQRLSDKSRRVMNDAGQVVFPVTLAAVPTRFDSVQGLLRGRIPDARQVLHEASEAGSPVVDAGSGDGSPATDNPSGGAAGMICPATGASALILLTFGLTRLRSRY